MVSVFKNIRFGVNGNLQCKCISDGGNKHNSQFLKTDCNPLGMESQSISDSQITASSERDPSHGAGNARLNFRASSGRTGAWSALLPESSPWLQVDFTRTVALAKIATQGRSEYDQWVTGYSLSYSVDGNYFPMYKLCGEIKVRKD